MHKILVSFPDPMHAWLSAQAEKRGEGIQTIIRDCVNRVQEGLAAPKVEKVREGDYRDKVDKKKAYLDGLKVKWEEFKKAHEWTLLYSSGGGPLTQPEFEEVHKYYLAPGVMSADEASYWETILYAYPWSQYARHNGIGLWNKERNETGVSDLERQAYWNDICARHKNYVDSLSIRMEEQIANRA